MSILLRVTIGVVVHENTTCTSKQDQKRDASLSKHMKSRNMADCLGCLGCRNLRLVLVPERPQISRPAGVTLNLIPVVKEAQKELSNDR